LNAIKDLHAILLGGPRNANSLPGKFRREQNCIRGERSIDIEDARFVPPPVDEMNRGLDDFEKAMHRDHDYPDLVWLALLHYQFEAIHPFRDGNGRVGRLLIPLLMCAWRHLPPDRPLLYLSRFFRRHQQEYADRLLAVAREGAWVEFFLQAVIEEASNAWAKAREMRELREKQRMQVANRPGRLSVVVDHLFSNPVITSKDVERVAEVSRETASKYIEILLNEGILSVAGERRWRRPYIAEGILRVLYDESTESFDSRTDGEAQSD
jgi:Fic family protein